MEYSRPDPDELLKVIEDETKKSKKGKLKIFFGYAAGVGKTFSMLEAAHEMKNAGIDVVVGYIEPHSRPETMQLLKGLEVIAPLELRYKGIRIREFDIDRAIGRKPEIILVDELAHTNGSQCRNVKRYQDIEELLNAGIDVYTTINVQHIESLNDIVTAITGIVVKERIPDSVFDCADQVELIDIEPDELISRLNKGKIYKAKQAEKALDNFFVKENLIALREIALRRTADRVNRAVDFQRNIQSKRDYITEEHILICVSSSPTNAKVIRNAARMSNAFRSEFTALFVETSDFQKMDKSEIDGLRSNIKLAEQLGAKIVAAYGDDVPKQISEYAKASGVSKIVIGRSNNKKRFIQKATLAEKLTELAPNVDIYIIPDKIYKYPKKKRKKEYIPEISSIETAKMIIILCVTTLIGGWFYKLGFIETNIVTVYILGVLITSAITNSRLYGILSSILSVVVFNFLFTEPRFTFNVYYKGYPITFFVMFLAALITSTLTREVKKQAKLSALKAFRTEVLLETSQKLQRAKDKTEIFKQGAKQIIKLLNKAVIIYPVNEEILGEPLIFKKDDEEFLEKIYTSNDEKAVAAWVLKNNKHAGATTNTLPGAKCLYLSIRNSDNIFAVLGIVIGEDKNVDAFEKNVLIAMLAEIALALEKEQINETKNNIIITAKQEQLRANLLRAISHDLRTPLTSISGNAGILMESSKMLDENKKLELYSDIYDDSIWLINLVENLLSVTKIENGKMNIAMQSELVDEVINEAIAHINKRKNNHKIEVNLGDELLMAEMDSRLIIQVIINLIDNAIKYTEEESSIIISAKKNKNMVIIEVADDGEGINDKAKGKLFDMFFTSGKNTGDGRRGLGLGLAICKSIVNAHGGEIYVKDNIPKGTIVGFTLHERDVKCYV
ncbi:MAG: sensor histidine kinase KdpD [Clostridium sp.]|nr:sensor histidine kinase KdpD [Clostridium sp.]